MISSGPDPLQTLPQTVFASKSVKHIRFSTLKKNWKQGGELANHIETFLIHRSLVNIKYLRFISNIKSIKIAKMRDCLNLTSRNGFHHKSQKHFSKLQFLWRGIGLPGTHAKTFEKVSRRLPEAPNGCRRLPERYQKLSWSMKCVKSSEMRDCRKFVLR